MISLIIKCRYNQSVIGLCLEVSSQKCFCATLLCDLQDIHILNNK